METITKQRHQITEGTFEVGQLLFINSVSDHYRINKVTEKAVLIECSDGKWIDNNTFVGVWLPISQFILQGVNSNPANSQHGIHLVDLPQWLIFQHSKKW